MKIIITEKQYNVLTEQQLPKSSEFDKVILNNKKYLGLSPINTQITPEYTKKINVVLDKKNVPQSERILLGSLINLIPVYEEYLDFKSIFQGIVNNDLEQINSGIIGMAQPFSGKAITSLLDWFTEKMIGKEQTDNLVTKRQGLINMTNDERQKLFLRYGYGGYDKWVKAGKPKL